MASLWRLRGLLARLYLQPARFPAPPRGKAAAQLSGLIARLIFIKAKPFRIVMGVVVVIA